MNSDVYVMMIMKYDEDKIDDDDDDLKILMMLL